MNKTSVEANKYPCRAVAVAQLVDRLLPIPEIHGSSPVIGKILYQTFWLLTEENPRMLRAHGSMFVYMQIPIIISKDISLLFFQMGTSLRLFPGRILFSPRPGPQKFVSITEKIREKSQIWTNKNVFAKKIFCPSDWCSCWHSPKNFFKTFKCLAF